MKNIYLEIKQKNTNAIATYVEKIKKEFLKRWLDEERTDFGQFVAINAQHNERYQNLLSEDLHQLSFYLGSLKGMTDIFKELYRADCGREEIIRTLAAQSPRTAQILHCLYENNGGNGMRHKELAETVGQSDSALSNIMKRIVQSGAVDVSRSGKNTFYTLSTIGERYCSDNERKDGVSQIILQKLDQLLAQNQQELIQCLPENDSRNLKKGDKFSPIVDNTIYDEIQIESIWGAGNKQYVKLTQTNKETESLNQLNQLPFPHYQASKTQRGATR